MLYPPLDFAAGTGSMIANAVQADTRLSQILKAMNAKSKASHLHWRRNDVTCTTASLAALLLHLLCSPACCVNDSCCCCCPAKVGRANATPAGSCTAVLLLQGRCGHLCAHVPGIPRPLQKREQQQSRALCQQRPIPAYLVHAVHFDNTVLCHNRR
jgi:hypothetical protein